MNVIWLIVLVVFLVVEASTVTMVSLWFALGALGAMITSLLGGELWLQVLVFVVVSGATLAALRPVARKYFTPKLTKTNVDSVIGARGVVVEDINNLVPSGQVKLDAMVWTARSSTDTPICAGTQVIVDRVEGVKLIVSPVPVATQSL